MKVFIRPPSSQWPQLACRPVRSLEKIEAVVKPIMERVRLNGDAALLEYSRQIDGVAIENLQVSTGEIEEASNTLSTELCDAIILAKNNIEKFHLAQWERPQVVETTPGVICSRRSVPIEKVGIYVPGGSAPLFSTLLMLAIPAKLAGCKEIVICTPPQKDGTINHVILFVAKLLECQSLFKLGGAQAIAAMAYGTETVPKVFKIFGPGNQYVTAAKLLASKESVAIDLPAGPSEVAVFADMSVSPAFIAADLLAQAEHNPDSQVVLVTTEESYAALVLAEVQEQLSRLPRHEIAKESLQNSFAVIIENRDQAMDFLNCYAPEHLILAVEEPEILAEKVTNAGSVFIGPYSTEALGDYASGTNHTLPTAQAARAFSGVSLDSFMKKITFQTVSGQGLQLIGPAVELMAEAEGLIGHQRAVSVRLQSLRH